MKKVSVMGLCLVASLAFSLVGVASSFASSDFPAERGVCKAAAKGTTPEFSEKTCQTPAAEGATKGFDWVPNKTTKAGKKITGTSGPATLRSTTPEGQELAAVKCEKSKVTGTINGPTKSNSVATFEGCSSAGEACKSAGQTGNTIVTFPLEGTLGVINGATDEAGEDIKGLGPGGLSAKFECGVNKIETKGSVIGKLTPVDLKGTKTTLEFKQVGGKQSPENLEGQPKDTLMTEINGLGGGTFPFASTQEETVTVTGPSLETRI